MPFLSFFMKSNTATPFFLFRYFEVFKLDVSNWKSEKQMKLSLSLGAQ